MIATDFIDHHIAYRLEQHSARLLSASYTVDQCVELLSRLAVATWRPPGDGKVSIDAAAADSAISLGARTPAFLQLCVEVGLLTRAENGAVRFQDAWLHGYLAARGLVHLLAGEHSDRGFVRDNAAARLQQIGAPAIPVMIAALAESDDAVGLGAAVVLRRIGRHAIPSLLAAVSWGNRRVRRWAVEALTSEENANAALPVLLRVLEGDEHPLVAGAAVGALGASRNPDAEPGLIAALAHTHPLVRMLAKGALEGFDSPRARRALDELARPTPTSAPDTVAAGKGGSSPVATSPASPSPQENLRRARRAAWNAPRIFISYAREDAGYAAKICGLLKLADFDPWMDSAGLLAGDAWESRLVEAIRTSDFVIALLSEHTGGGYQETELRLAAQNAPAGREPDVPFIVTCIIGRLLRSHVEEPVPDFLQKSAIMRFWSVEANWLRLHATLCASTRAVGLPVPALLRSKPRIDFDEAAASEMIVRRNFFDSSRNTGGGPPAMLKPLLNGALVEDRATGRVWTHSCGAALPYLGVTHARMVAWKANDEGLGNVNDWRLPTLEEAMSLMTPDKNNSGLFVSHLFSDDGYVLTCDACAGAGGSLVWVAAYATGDCQPVPADAPVPVRLVRTDWEHLQPSS